MWLAPPPVDPLSERPTETGAITPSLRRMPHAPTVYDLCPKVELHLHIEGAIPHRLLWERVTAYGGDPAVPDADAMRRMFSYRDFPHFIETWWWMTGWLRTAEDFAALGRAVASELVEQRIVYAEASISPSDFARHRLALADMAVAVRQGLDSIDGVEVALTVDLVRDKSPAGCAAVLEEAIDAMADAGIVAITIGGSEQGHPPEPFAAVYRRAESAGLRLTAHAGEAAGPESVRGALDALGVERIGHGVRSVEDPELLARLVRDQVPLEVCPTSNLRTGVAASWESHPVGTLLDAGALVTISTDDPAFFHCDLAGELRQVSELFGDGPETAATLTRQAIVASWLAADDAARLDDAVAAWWNLWRSGITDPGPIGVPW